MTQATGEQTRLQIERSLVLCLKGPLVFSLFGDYSYYPRTLPDSSKCFPPQLLASSVKIGAEREQRRDAEASADSRVEPPLLHGPPLGLCMNHLILSACQFF